jgi:hypothetical protein
MDVEGTLKELREEHMMISESILAIERLATGRRK